MTRIQSSVGLITGIPIEETVSQLMAISARPRDLLDARTKTLQSEQLAVSKLSSLVLAFQFEANRFASASLFQSKTVTSSDEEVLTASIQAGATPAVGSYKIRALQTATSQQLLSNGITNASDLASSGTLTFGIGGFVDTGLALVELNGGAGVSPGKIRITDRGGNSADIDLRAARTVDDVLRAINNNEIEVTASAVGDSFRLTDNTGGSGNLRVQELGGGTTAAGLGLAGINLTANVVTGADVFSLHADTKLSLLNDGNGVELRNGVDLVVSLADESTLNIDLGAAVDLGDVLAAINAANPSKLSASIGADGNRLELTDLTIGSGTFAVANGGVGTAASDLGLTNVAALTSITGQRLISGLRDTLVSSLRGGAGLGTLGQISITNRNNVTSNVDLSSTETLSDVVAEINSQATGVTAAINSARNGIVLTDVTGATASNLVIADGDANNSATALGIATNAAATSINSGSLSRQTISRATLLSSLNQGNGVDLNDFRITDSNGLSATVDMNTFGNEPKTVGNVIDRINALAVDVAARINDTGDGILLFDLANGSGSLEVKEAGNGSAAANLRLLGLGKVMDINGQPTSAIDGTRLSSIDLASLDEPAANVLLSSLNGGNGIDFGAFRITDSNGDSDVVVISSAAGTFNSIADVIEAINATDIEVEARLNESGSGILLIDTARGTGTLEVEELAGGTTAADLRLDRAVKSITVDNQLVQAIDGVGAFTQVLDESPLAAVVARVNSLQAGVTASSIFDGGVYRLSLSVNQTGAGRELMVDGEGAGFSFGEFSFAQNAVVELGGTTLGSGIVVSSTTNDFDNVVSGLNLAIVQPSDKTISVDVAVSNAGAVEAAQDFVDAFNSIRKHLDDVTAFDEAEATVGILFGSQAALRVETDLTKVVSSSFFGVGKFASLEAVGININSEGQLSLNKSKFEKAFADDPAALTTLFTHKTLGVLAKLDAAIERLAGDQNAALSTRIETLADQIERNTSQISAMNVRLERERERLFNQFAALEAAIASLQQNLTALASLQIIPPLSINRNNR